MDISRRVLVSILFVLLVFPLCVSAQSRGFGTIEGTVKEAITGFPLSYANVTIVGTGRGMPTDTNGEFKFEKVPAGEYRLRASYIGYTPMTQPIEVKAEESLMVDFTLDEAVIMGHEVLVSASRAKERETPVAFTEVTNEEVSEELATLDVPMILNTTPSVYATEQGGGSGDARLNVRGFNQRNIAVMINGVPVNDMENGWVYWSNWAALGDVTDNIQIQRGLGASPYSVSSIGGVVNVQTLSSSSALERKALLKQQFGSNNLAKTSVMFSSGLLDNDVAFSGLVSKKTGDGYVDETWTDEFGYFFTIGKKFGSHNLDLTVVGAPQEHGQRRSNESIATFQTRGLDYNDDWGYLHGKKKHLSVNFYHKPVMNLNWNWIINNQTLLASVLYASWGTGGGTGPYGDYWFKYDDAGQLDFSDAWAVNDTSSTGSLAILRASRNNHSWYGFLSTLKHDMNKNFNLTGGVDFRYYRGEHYRTIEDLMGGDYFLNDSNNNRDPEEKLFIGDKIAYHNDGLVMLGGGFLQAEYKNPVYSIFGNLSASQTRYKRVDYFLKRDENVTDYDKLADMDPVETDWEAFTGYTAKGGANYNINEAMNVFFNGGYLVKAPDFDATFGYINEFKDPPTEKIIGLEVGYGIRTSTMAILLNAYYTSWKDKFIQDSKQIGQDYFTFDYQDMEALHKGVEFEGRYFLTPELEVEGMVSVSENTWEKDAAATIKDDDGNEIGKQNLAVEDLYVGNFPMTTMSFGFRYNTNIGRGINAYLHPVYKYFGRQYADFEPGDRDFDPNNPDDADREQSWEMPDYALLDIHAGFSFKKKDSFFERMTINMNLFNALNKEYIADAEDGWNHEEETVSVYYGRGRTWNLGVSFEF